MPWQTAVAGVEVRCGGSSGAHREKPEAGLQAVHNCGAAAQAHRRRLVVGHQRLDHRAQRAHTCSAMGKSCRTLRKARKGCS